MNRLQSFILAIVIAAASSRAQQAPTPSAVGNVTLTDSESLWRHKFADCDLGYRALLPDGFVAHGNHPPNPIRGFLVGLPDVSTTKTVTVNDERFIHVGAEYNSLEFESLKELADHTIELMGKEKSAFKITIRERIKLDGVTATRAKAEFDSPSGRVIEEELITLRSGIIYKIGLRTDAVHYETDKAQFAKIAAGFRFWKIHYC
jgi:hypothetical protein